MSSTLSNDILTEIYRTGKVYDLAGKAVSCNSHIPRKYMEVLYRTVLEAKPKLVVEVGMAHGVSSLAILTALDKIGKDGQLISIDPFQSTDWQNIGVANVARSGFAKRHQLLESYDYLALPQLLDEGVKIDFAYIDGWHTFDYVLLDIFYIDKMLRPRGIIGFNDCGYLAIHKALNFLQGHRKYKELNVGLKSDYQAGTLLKTAVRHALRISNADRYFRKLENWEPNWNFYARF